MNKEAINKQIQELEAKVAELKAQVNKPEKDEWPKLNNVFYYIFTDGDIMSTIFSNDTIDKGLKSIGNMFRTKEQAERRLEQLKLIQELREFGGDKGGYFLWATDGLKWTWACGYAGLVQFPSSEKVKEAIEHFGDRLNILLPSND